MLRSRYFWIGGSALLVLILALGIGSLMMGGSNMSSYDRSYTMESAPTLQATSVAVGAVAAPSRGYADAADGIALVTEEESAAPAEAQERVILRDANLSVIVEDTVATIERITTLANDSGGWVVTSNTRTNNSSGGTYTTGSITVRVPAEGLDDALDIIREAATEVTQEQVNGRDVTEEYVDLSSRLRNLEATESQLAEIMESAYSVEDVLAVQVELSQVRGNIESIEGRLRYFDEASAYSSVTVSIREEVPSIGEVQVNYWNPFQTAENALGTLVILGQMAVDGLIVLVIIGLPILLVGGGIVWGLWKLFRRGRRRTSTAPATPENN